MSRLRVMAAIAVLAVSAPAVARDGRGGVIISLYAAGEVPSLGVPEIREDRNKTGEITVRNVSVPTLELFRPAAGHANGTAVIVAPGGGFVGLDYDSAGTAVARALAERGVTALVLKYRLILSPADPQRLPAAHEREMTVLMARAINGSVAEVPRFAGEVNAVADGARAMRIVRRRAAEWGVDRKRIGMIGFSAGAFLAVDLAIGDAATRPDFVGLLYGGLRTPVPRGAPPAFIAAAADDEMLPNDAPPLYTAWRRAGAAAELHVFEHGGHGFDLKSKGTTSDHWFDEFTWWMQSRGLLGPASRAR